MMLIEFNILIKLKKYECIDITCRVFMFPSRSNRHNLGIKFSCEYCSKSETWSKNTWFEKIKPLYYKCLMSFWIDKIAVRNLMPLLTVSNSQLLISLPL